MMYNQINIHSLISANIFGIKNSIKICHVSHNVLRHMSHTGVSPGNICYNYIYKLIIVTITCFTI